MICYQMMQKKNLTNLLRMTQIIHISPLKEALQAAAEGKLPVPMKDGQLLPIEIDLKVRFDPNSRAVEVIQS